MVQSPFGPSLAFQLLIISDPYTHSRCEYLPLASKRWQVRVKALRCHVFTITILRCVIHISVLGLVFVALALGGSYEGSRKEATRTSGTSKMEYGGGVERRGNLCVTTI